jgi:GNAT superfamily N-acetyltransferase
MSDDYTLTIFGHGDRAAFNAAFAADGTAVDPAVQHRRIWWCFDNPAGGAFCIMRSGTTIAATSYLGGKRIRLGDAVIEGFEIGETATMPAHQRRGLFSKLVRASCAHASSALRGLIYGTPNSQSTPGYAKLGFAIVEDARSWLFLLPNLRFALPVPWPRGRAVEIDGAQYVAETVTFPRLNDADEAYLNWRLVGAPMPYRFFRYEVGGAVWHVAFRPGQLGRFATLICAEYFRDGARPPVADAAGVVRTITRGHFRARGHAAIQLHGPLPNGANINGLRLRGIVPHRILPICAVEAGDADAGSWFDRFQLSDCDIG